MTSTVWSKFYWSDWSNDPALRLCSLAAQGFWMRLLCIAAEADPTGYVVVNGRPLDGHDLARLTGVSVPEVETLLQELDRNGVFSRDSKARIFSRRMVRDAKKAAIARKNGKNGGNPSLCNNKENLASDNPPLKACLNTHKPYANSQIPKERKKIPKKEPASLDLTGLPDWLPPDRVLEFAEHRRQIRKPMTQLALDKLLVELDRLRGVGDDPLACMEKSIVSGWAGVFPTNPEAKAKLAEKPRLNRPENTDDWAVSACRIWKTNPDEWLPSWGPPPDHPACRIPPEVLEQYGLNRRAA